MSNASRLLQVLLTCTPHLQMLGFQVVCRWDEFAFSGSGFALDMFDTTLVVTLLRIKSRNSHDNGIGLPMFEIGIFVPRNFHLVG